MWAMLEVWRCGGAIDAVGVVGGGVLFEASLGRGAAVGSGRPGTLDMMRWRGWSAVGIIIGSGLGSLLKQAQWKHRSLSLEGYSSGGGKNKGDGTLKRAASESKRG